MADGISDTTTILEWDLLTAETTPSATATPEVERVRSGQFADVFDGAWTRSAIGRDADDARSQRLRESLDYAGFVQESLENIVWKGDVREEELLLRLLCVGIAAFQAFLQANITGPPLSFGLEKLLPESIAGDNEAVARLNKEALHALSVDGESAYHLTPNPLLLILAKAILQYPKLSCDNGLQTARWWRLRVNFMHQRILPERTYALQNEIYRDIEAITPFFLKQGPMVQTRFYVEVGMVNTYFGLDEKAKKSLETAAELTGLKYVLTGAMGKRTKFQQRDTSQLVVIAASKGGYVEQNEKRQVTVPEKLDLNDDTLLEKISFTGSNENGTTNGEAEDAAISIPPEIADIDPSRQPPLQPLDATILLLLTETIKNTNPGDGITREEMLPYAERVLQHPTNWEVYTLALLARSRIEGYKSRTIERSVLQLQVVVDQVIAETTGKQADGSNGVTTFLPKAKEEESASIQERLQYIHQLSIPPRWELEAELANRWAHLGALRTALEIYERLEMWPETALCWAATDQEEKAREIIRAQLFDLETEKELDPAPDNAPRLWCILGDMDKEPTHYERAWDVSGGRYARAKRSLGRYYIGLNNHRKAAEAFGDSLKLNPLNAQSWFALGCCWLQLEAWNAAVRAFGRTVGIDDTDAEAWANMATALLNRVPEVEQTGDKARLDDEDDELPAPKRELNALNQNRQDALRALKRAAALKRESWKIWENYLTVAASTAPPSYYDVLLATRQLISIRGKSAGETAIDVDVLEMLVNHIIISEESGFLPSKPGLAKMVVELMDRDVVPLITTDPRLWKLVGKLALWRKKPKEALEAHEKAWRCVSGRPGIEEKGWGELVEETVSLRDAYESLGEMRRTGGLGKGEMVEKAWRFKARTLVRGVCSRGKERWEGTESFARLEAALEELKS